MAEQDNKNQFLNILKTKKLHLTSNKWLTKIESYDVSDVDRVLSRPPGRYDIESLSILLSPAAEQRLEQMAQLARQLTIQRFGRTVHLYAPLYLSNLCCNSCLYCGFNKDAEYEKTRLTIDQAVRDAEIIHNEGFRDLLLVSSEDRQWVTIDYLCELAERLRDKFSSLSIEIHQLEKDQYKKLFEAGIEGVTIYQETYFRDVYEKFHPAGPKADYARRIRAADDLCSAGMRNIGLGALLGLNDYRLDTLSLAEHAYYLMKKYLQSRVPFSFPRIRPANKVQAQMFDDIVTDTQLTQMVLALRLSFADTGLVLSTRESAELRDNFLNLGITRVSAGSKTNPGGYSSDCKATEQFEIDDSRSPAEVAQKIRQSGLEPVWKDWDRNFIGK